MPNTFFSICSHFWPLKNIESIHKMSTKMRTRFTYSSPRFLSLIYKSLLILSCYIINPLLYLLHQDTLTATTKEDYNMYEFNGALIGLIRRTLNMPTAYGKEYRDIKKCWSHVAANNVANKRVSFWAYIF